MVRTLSFCFVMALASCRYDLTIPEPAPLGGVTGSLDTQGHVPAEGRSVVLVRDDGARTTVTTAAEGRFDFTSVTPGRAFLEVTVPGFAPVVVPGVVIKPGATTDVGVLQPVWLQTTARRGGLSGRVVSNSGPPPQGATVALVLEGGSSQPVERATTDVTGAFAVSVAPGTYRLRVTHPYFVLSQRTMATVEEEQDTTLTAPIVLEINPATIEGQVRLESPDPLAPAMVGDGVLVNADVGVSATSSALGAYRLESLPGGDRALTFTKANYEPLRLSVAVAPGQMADGGEVLLRLERGALSGEVELADGKRVADVGVTVTVPGLTVGAVVAPVPGSPSRGRYLLSQLPTGSYTVQAVASGYAPVTSAAFQVRANTTTSVDAVRLTAVSGAFSIDDGDPTNTAGFTRTRAVTLDLSRFLNPTRVRFAENNSTLTGVAFQPYVQGMTYGLTLSAGDGSKVVFAQYEGAGGVLSPIESATVVLDTVAPSNTSVTLQSGVRFTNATNPRVEASAEDLRGAGVDRESGLAFMRLSESGAVDAMGQLTGARVPYSRFPSFQRTGTTEGRYALFAQFIDNAGNTSAPVSDDVIIDTLPPAGGSAVIEQGAAALVPGFTNTEVVTLTLGVTAEPNDGGVYVQLANQGNDVTASPLRDFESSIGWSVNPVGDGLKTVQVRFVDSAGNASGVFTRTITLDRQAPSPATVALPATEPDALFTTTTVPLALNAADTNGLTHSTAVTVSTSPTFSSLAASTAYPVSGQLNFTLPPVDGPHVVYVRFRDAAGNASVASLNVTLDRTPPTAQVRLRGQLGDNTVVTGADDATSTLLVASGAVSVVLSEASDVASVAVGDQTLSCAAATYVAVTGQVAVPTLTGDGNKTVRVCVKDAAGNVAGPFTRLLELDTLPPSCTLSATGVRADGSATAAPPGFTGRPGIRVTVTCGATPADEVALSQGAVTCTASAPVTWQSSTSAVTMNLVGTDGPFTIAACLRDRAGNTSSATSTTITLDTQAPTGTVTVHGGKAYFNQADFIAAPGAVVNVAQSSSGATSWAIGESNPPTAYRALTTSFDYPLLSTADGARVIYVLFRDDVGNTSALVAQRVTVDRTPPTVATTDVSIRNTAANPSFISTDVAQVGVRTVADASFIRLAGASGAGPCSATELATAVEQPATGRYAIQLPPGQGLRRVCAEYRDAAGNASSPITLPITVDTIPPVAPIAITLDKLISAPDNTPFQVEMTAAADTNFDRYEIVGGTTTDWTNQAPAAGRFSFTLSNAGDETGTRNVLRVRARDLADNLSDEASVVVVADTNPPNFPQANVGTLPPRFEPWVDNAAGRATVHWQPSDSEDIAGYLVHYGPAADPPNYDVVPGSYATEGPSPIATGLDTRFTLSGLINESVTYVKIQAVDRAGNRSELQPSSMSNAIKLQPNEVSPNLIGFRSLPFQTPSYHVQRMAVQNDVLYLGVTIGECNQAAGASTQLRTMALSPLRARVHNGERVDAGVPDFTTANAGQFSDGARCFVDKAAIDLLVDGQYAYLASGSKIHIFSLSNPLVPALVTSLDFFPLGPATPDSAVLRFRSLQVIGDRLVAAGGNWVAVVSLADLFDGNASTVPTISGIGSDLHGLTRTNDPPANMEYATLTRRRLVVSSSTQTGVGTWDLTNALDSSFVTQFTDAGFVGDSISPTSSGRGLVSGNYMYQGAASVPLSIMTINSLWSTPLSTLPIVGSMTTFAAGQFDVVGNMAVVGSQAHAMEIFDLSRPATPRRVTRLAGALADNAIMYGPYAITAQDEAVAFYELATPRGLHYRSSATDTGYGPIESGAFMIANGVVVDTQSGNGSLQRYENDNGSAICSTGHTLFGDVEVLANGNGVQVINLEKQLDRSSFTVPVAGDRTNIAAASRITDVAAYGNQLIAVEVRNNGIFLEVFRASDLRDAVTAPNFSPATATRGSFQVASTVTDPQTLAALTMYRGRALISLYSTPGAATTPAGDNLFVVDLRPLLDDSAATTMSLSNILAKYRIANATTATDVTSTMASDGWLFFTTRNQTATSASGTFAIDLRPAFNEPASAVGTLPTLKQVSSGSYDQVLVYGGYAFSNGGTGVAIADVADPNSARPMGFVPGPGGASACSPAQQGVFQTIKSGLVVHGARAWANDRNTTIEYELE